MLFNGRIALLALLGAGFLGTTRAEAYSYFHLDRLALQMQQQASVLHREVHAHFRNTPQFSHLDADVAKLEKLARHIHEVAHNHGDINHIRRDVEQIDRLYHHVQDLVRGVSYSGQISPREIRHLNLAVGQLGNTIHHLRADLQPCPFDALDFGFSTDCYRYPYGGGAHQGFHPHAGFHP